MAIEKTHRNIGIDAKPPEQTCSDSKCPWHGRTSLRGKVFTGKVVSGKAAKTAVVRWEYVTFIRKYERYERKHSRVVAYNPDCISARQGDTVRIAECRPLSKTKSFVVIEKIK